ncbi:AMP-binding protein [Limnohabitans sp. Rim11]|uniref:AMP-binding protein n=1 Tax=Limnohabitans sp. Rim11 TaxID=1100719 RepID=UPI000A68C707|nr:AMP-binding protein [Limnohabitans sp. Rim11]
MLQQIHNLDNMNSAIKQAETSTGYASAGKRKLSIESLWHRGSCLASALRDKGVTQDSAVALLLRNDLPFLEAMVATSILGAYAVPINWHLMPQEVEYILRDSGAKALIAHADLYRSIAHVVPTGVATIVASTPESIRSAYEVSVDACIVPATALDIDVVIDGSQPLHDRSRVGSRGSIVYTSGTTGRPKGVRRFALPPEEARKFSELSKQWFDLKPGVRTIMAGPMYHSAPNTYTRSVLSSGGSIVLMPRFDAEELLALIEQDRITHLHIVPTMMVRLLRLPREVRERYDLSSLEFVIHGAAPCALETKKGMIDWWGPVLHEYYAATETGMVTRASTRDWLDRPGTLGRAWPGRSICIYAENGDLLGPNQTGEIYVGLQGVPNFTYQNAESQRVDIGREGMVTNGDVGYLDSEGYLFLVDRKKDIVISGGVNIYPAEIECALIEHPGVADCAVIGIPDEEFGERLLAFIKPSPGLEPSQTEINIFLRSKLASLKVPKEYLFMQELPRDDSGKLMKRKLRDPYWAGRSRMI